MAGAWGSWTVKKPLPIHELLDAAACCTAVFALLAVNTSFSCHRQLGTGSTDEQKSSQAHTALAHSYANFMQIGLG